MVDTIKKMTTFFREDFATTHMFEKELARQLKIPPLACAVRAVPGYHACGSEVFAPPRKLLSNGDHVMLLVAYGRLKGRRLFEFQDSNGLWVGSRGFVKFAAGSNLITEFLVIDV
uniref:Uncharacterized protein n=1 Tax=Noccaea caerulescens TaxID=107243 RepID=A0A1J3JZ34_NOCCA